MGIKCSIADNGQFGFELIGNVKYKLGSTGFPIRSSRILEGNVSIDNHDPFVGESFWCSHSNVFLYLKLQSAEN